MGQEKVPFSYLWDDEYSHTFIKCVVIKRYGLLFEHTERDLFLGFLVSKRDTHFPMKRPPVDLWSWLSFDLFHNKKKEGGPISGRQIVAFQERKKRGATRDHLECIPLCRKSSRKTELCVYEQCHNIRKYSNPLSDWTILKSPQSSMNRQEMWLKLRGYKRGWYIDLHPDY